MLLGVLPASQLLPPGARIEDLVLLRAVRAFILQAADEPPFQAACDGVDWDDLRQVAARNKLAVLLLRGLNQGARGVPDGFLAELREQQDAVVHLNTRNLMTLRHLVPLLEAEGVESVVIKGPCAQKLLHGDFFAKPSLDVDLLVARRDFDLAGRVVADNGFAVAEECLSPWWKVFLGEQHFLARDRMHTAVDLHHQTQQPGCPAPSRPDLILSRCASVAIGSQHIRTISPTNATLLSCMSLAKALVHREPAGGHVCDIAAGLEKHSQDQLAQLAADADTQGLRNTLALGLRAARLLFGARSRIERGEGNVLADVSDADLLKMILRPWESAIAWPRRSRILNDLCDSVAAHLKEVCWKVAEEVCGRWYRRKSR